MLKDSSGDKDKSSIFQSKIREEDLDKSQKIEKLKKVVNELAKKAASEKQLHEQMHKKIYSNLDDKVNNLLSQVESLTQNDNSESDDGRWRKIYAFFKNFFSEFGIYLKKRDFKLHFLKKGKDKNWLFSIIQAFYNGVHKLLSKAFKRDLSWYEVLEKEIKALNEKIENGELSQDDLLKALERLKTLYNLKFLSPFLAGFVVFLMVGFFPRIFGFELGFAEITKEEGKKIEPKALEIKQERENVRVESKASEKEVQPKNLEKPLVNPEKIRNEERMHDSISSIIPIKQDLGLSSPLIKPDPFVLTKPIDQEHKVQQKPRETTPPPQPKAPGQLKARRPAARQEEVGFQRVYKSDTEEKHNRVGKVETLPSDKKKIEVPIATPNNKQKVDKIEVLVTNLKDMRKMDNVYGEFLQELKAGPNVNKQNVAKNESISERVPSELAEVKVENLNRGRSV
jgi:hypothetical protein